MEPVNRLNKLLEVLRQKHASTQSSKTTSSKRSESNKNSNVAKKGSTNTHDIGKLKSSLRSRLKSLPAEDLKSDKAHAIFLEAVLTWEFGVDLLNDQEFYTMVDNLKDTMTKDAKLKQMIDSALMDLVDS